MRISEESKYKLNLLVEEGTVGQLITIPRYPIQKIIEHIDSIGEVSHTDGETTGFQSDFRVLFEGDKGRFVLSGDLWYADVYHFRKLDKGEQW